MQAVRWPNDEEDYLLFSLKPQRSMSCALGFQGFRLGPDRSLSQTDSSGVVAIIASLTIWICLFKCFFHFSQCHNGSVALFHA